MTLEPDTGSLRAQIGRYELVSELGRGGMAVVYLARQPDLDRLIALKELAAFGMHDPQMVHRFLREAQISASLSDPNIVTVHESFIEGGTPYIAMEYLAPGSLRPLVGRLRIDQSIAVMQDVLHGLSAAEKRGIVHRDLKPENLLLTEDGHVKIADFGIAKAVDRATTAEFQTAAGTTVGTPTYMAPEQAMGLTLTPASDLYSVGVIAYELMVGRLPFDAESPVALLLQHVSDPPPPPLTVNPDLDPQIGAWIERLLVKEPETRTSHAGRAWDELEEIAISTLGPRWRRGATLPDPREHDEQPRGPASNGDSGYLTVDPARFEPGRPPVGRTEDQVTFIRPETPPPRVPTPPPAARSWWSSGGTAPSCGPPSSPASAAPRCSA
jgi:serine/threonine protein kinase